MYSYIIGILSIKGTLSILFLPNISYPSPNRAFSFEKGKNIWTLLGPNIILICKTGLQSSSLATTPIAVIHNSTVSLRVQGRGCGLWKNFIFLSPTGFPCIFKWVMGRVLKREHFFSVGTMLSTVVHEMRTIVSHLREDNIVHFGKWTFFLE